MENNDIQDPEANANAAQASQEPEPDQNNQGDGSKDKAPWEREGEEFNPEKAWKLIQNLKAEKQALAEKNRAFENEKLSEQERTQRDLDEANAKLAQTLMAQAIAEARAEHPQLTEEDFELIGAGSPDEVKAKAAKLAERLEAQAASQTKQINPIMRSTPRGGSDPTSAPSKDWLRDILTH
ncbi:MAG: hypothetical protein SO360_01840 [Bifidobacterium tsurumiense]|uniref:hypothetical protein n=1 Tax=Bifidobacterium tsurumiense TaxID=356829 RepID=UPI002A80CCAA|nr:hypothetical protein [Bifidobacterium tsurumiense]MDY4677594.1 hypothetical protein [Bifidobacterium tsurumiense]